MQRPAALAALFIAVAGTAPAQAVSETEEGFAAAMQGCWNRVSWSAAIEAQRADPGYSRSLQMCLSGGVEGTLTMLDCGGVHDLVECSPREGRYAFRDEKFWSDLGHQPDEDFLHACDVLLDAGKQVTLHNCEWADARAGTDAIEDAVYERAVAP